MLPRSLRVSAIRERVARPVAETDRRRIRQDVQALFTETDWDAVYEKPPAGTAAPDARPVPQALGVEAVRAFLEQESGMPVDSYARGGDSMLIVEMDSGRGRLSVADAVIRGFKRFFEHQRVRREGLQLDSEWVVVDLGSIMVHVMSPAARREYALERNWAMADAEAADPGALAGALQPRSVSQDPMKLARLEDGNTGVD